MSESRTRRRDLRCRLVPRFHLHIRNGSGFTADEQGLDLPDLLGAHQEAVKGARSLLSAEVMDGKMDLAGQIEIADGDGRVVDVVRFRDVVEIKGGDPT